MKYYYFNPLSKQYYFPEGFQKYPVFSTFYKAYKLSARIIWKIWRNVSIIRNLFYTNEVEEILPIEHIRKYVSPDSILAFNLGTKGIDQKVSVLSIDTTTNYSFFIKYATSKIARENVLNEGLVLQQLSKLPFVPKLILSTHEDDIYTLIKTSVLSGEKTKLQPLNDRLLDILYTLSQQNVKSNRDYKSDLLRCFAHGDFCPWNMLSEGCKINIFDWEMAGQYPLGYDLFTYIFQYEFLVKEIKRFDKILKENSLFIQQYFSHFMIDNWIPYVHEFAKIKYEIELKKNNPDLIESYLSMEQEVLTYDYLDNFNIAASTSPIITSNKIRMS